MSTQPYTIGIVLFATINGIFSPYLIFVIPFVLVLMPGFLVGSTSVLFFASSILLATITLIVGGIPAALYERWTGAGESTDLSMWIWLAGVGILTIPAAANFFQFGL
jgi:hypothetical protein